MSNLMRFVNASPLWASLLLCFLSFHTWADDPLSALPTATDSLQAKLYQTTRGQREFAVEIETMQRAIGR